MIDNLGDLKKLLQLCRKQGVTELEFDNVKLKLGELPREQEEVVEEVVDKYAGFPEGELTPEQLIFYSAGGLPQDDPELQ